ncbi:NTP transferase domain-containing protein [Nesterenkonia alba]|uniref:NTP transferase domain-containing protein n=1 Tax=Nesterenkonia alba TaxID=515814 RepID=UPI0003B4E845|nr:NTP transferase domain-containing protein [Nesterenkonia alba]
MPPLETAVVGGIAAILLAGGRGSRLGGVDKAVLRHNGRTLLNQWTTALSRRRFPTVVVGPDALGDYLPESVVQVREDPPFSGPAAALWTGARALERDLTARPLHCDTERAVEPPEYVVLLAVDVVDPEALLQWLVARIAEAPADHAVVPEDHTGRHQLLASAVPYAQLVDRARALQATEVAGAPARVLLSGIPAVNPVMPAGLGEDVDTPADAERLGIHLD